MTTATPQLFSALGDPTRWAVLETLAEQGEATATTLAGRLPVTRAAVLKHINVLDDAGLIDRRKSGREVIFRVDASPLRSAALDIGVIADEWDARLNAIKRLAEG